MERKEVLIGKKTLKKRIKQLAEQITKDYEGEKVTFMCILKGSLYFFADLTRRVDLDTELEFIRISTYQGQESTREPQMKLYPDNPVTGKNVVVVEDIIDTGITLDYLLKELKEQHPKSLKLCTLLDKPERREVENVNVDYVGFKIPNRFVIGFGLDLDEQYRTLNKVYCITDDPKEKIQEDKDNIKLQLVRKPKKKTE